MECDKRNCVFYNENHNTCILPEDENFRIKDKAGNFHCINEIYNICELSAEGKSKLKKLQDKLSD